MVNHKIVPGVLTWPTTSQVIEETRTENLQVCFKKKKKGIKTCSVKWPFQKIKTLSSSLPAHCQGQKEMGGQNRGFSLEQPVQVLLLIVKSVVKPKNSSCNDNFKHVGSIPFTTQGQGLCVRLYAWVFLRNNMVLICSKCFIMC